jgi:regulator of RNase E activity RraA
MLEFLLALLLLSILFGASLVLNSAVAPGEASMHNIARILDRNRISPGLAILILFLLAGTRYAVSYAAQSPQAAESTVAPAGDSALVNGFRHVEVASVSDALEQLTGKKMYMSHRMRPLFPSKFAGHALTVLLKKETNHDPDALKGMLTAIDQGAPDSVYVMVVEDGVDIAGMGGLMGTAMSARNFSGAVIDGGVRDVSYLQKIGFPVFALGVVPSTSVGHYRFAGSNLPVVCDGVPVNPSDIVVADADGVVVVPRAEAAKVLALAQELDYKEHSMYGTIEKLKSIEKAVAQFGRL